MSDMDRQKDHWAKYFEDLFMANPLSRQLPNAWLQTTNVDPHNNKITSSNEEAFPRMSGGKSLCVCNISTDLLKTGGPAMIPGLHAALTPIWQSGSILPDWKRRLIIPT